METDDRRAAQVCDRCRIKKIGCDGNVPSCAKCASAGTECTRSTSLLRKTKPRRHGKIKADEVDRLKGQINELQNAVIQQRPQAPGNGPSVPIVTGPTIGTNVSLSPQFSDKPNAKESSKSRPGSVIKHLGRLVSVLPGQDFFAGSTTGVHFVRSVEQQWQHLSESNDAFPDLFFRMHLLAQPTMLYPFADRFSDTPRTNASFNSGDLYLSEDYYLGRIQNFLSRWNTVFPMFCQKQVLQTFSTLLFTVKANRLSEADSPDLYRMLLVLSIEAWDAQDLASGQDALHYYKAAMRLESEALECLSIGTVQSRLLKVLYLHLSGKHAMISCEVGSTVRAAQSIGLHRQSRRFKLCAGEAECRTRLWWCVSIFDILTSTAYGLPKIISNVDVDVLLPTDCEFDDMQVAELPVPLPGEICQTATFIAFVKLHIILQQAAQLLFTTTERRDGEVKIHRLERQLRVWRYENAHLTEPGDFAACYLNLASHFSLLLIHQPGLTMDENPEQINASMETSVESALGILQVLTKAQHERRLFYLQPSATRMAFQSALMCLYYAWHKTSINLPSIGNSVTAPETLDSAIEMACNIMNLHRCDLAPTDATSSTQLSETAQWDLNQAAITLRGMVKHTYSSLGEATQSTLEPLMDLGSVAANNTAMQNPTEDWMGQSSLWELNAASLEEWSEGLRLESMDHYLPPFGLE